VYALYKKICEHYKKLDLIEILDVDDKNDSFVLDKIKKSINDCNLFVCDLTSDCKIDDINKSSLVNSNVMLEIGYAIAKNREIICILNTEANGGKITSLMNGFLYCNNIFHLFLNEIY
jgi:hypothetical protein